ncbi:MAG: sigma 54-interacting transcriptional regulator [Desulfomonile tiedjei]|nr:sigma 54-interacting transcriptional regulator [Desulfomonile tiedjei]
MRDKDETNRGQSEQNALLIDQSLRYAQDIVRVYEEEKAKRRQLEEANEQLLHEIAERKRTEQALRESEERFRAIFETAQDCVYIKDSSLRYTHVNPAMENLLQLKTSQIIGRTDEQLYGRKAGQHLKDTDRRVIEGESVEEEHTRPINGIPTTLLEAKVPLRDSAGNIVGICGIAHNITDRKSRAPIPPVARQEYPSKLMQAALAQARLVASQSSLVLLLGESGTGKDFLARYIHEHSERANGPFFAINCASVAPELAESELFGHEAGAFTGARARKRGLLELAEGGTLFLNEIGELSSTLQAKLLTFLDTRSFTRVGGEKNISVNARLIAATNRELEKDVAEGKFRRDLFYRLNVLSIRIPPLHERIEDIPVLVQQLLRHLQSELRLAAPPVFDSDAVEALKAYDWPGNVRELRNVLERALILSGGGRITRSHLGLEVSSDDWTFATNFPEDRSLNEVVRDLKRSLVVEALHRSRGSRMGAARILGISRNSMNHYLATLGMEFPTSED